MLSMSKNVKNACFCWFKSDSFTGVAGDPTGLGKDYDMSQYITEEDIQMELEKTIEKCRRKASAGEG